MVTMRQMLGHTNPLSGLMSAPAVNLRPWFSIIVSHVLDAAGTAYSWSPKDIGTFLVTQLGLTNITGVDSAKIVSQINIKLKRVDLYAASGLAATDRPSCSLKLSSPIASIGDPTNPGAAEVFYPVIKSLEDVGTLSEAAKVSWTYGTSHQEMPLSTDSSFTIVEAAANVKFSTIRFHIMFNFGDDAPPQVVAASSGPADQPNGTTPAGDDFAIITLTDRLENMSVGSRLKECESA